MQADPAEPGTGFDLLAAVDRLPYGLAFFDAGHRLVLANRNCRERLALPASLLAPGTPLAEILLVLARRGDLGPGAPEEIARVHARTVAEAAETITRRLEIAGRHLDIRTTPLADGGLAFGVLDVSARVGAERALAESNRTLEDRVEDRTSALTRLNAELERAKAKADAANQEKTRFLAAASHDLLQPLNAARLYTSTLWERSRGTPLAELANSIDAALNAVEEIMTTLLEISRMDSGALRIARTRFDASELCRKIEIEFRPLAAEKNIALKVRGRPMPVQSDRALLGRVLQNLVSNAIKYTQPGGRVLVGCRRHGQGVRIDVLDTGIGIDIRQQQMIFDEFSRLEQGARIAPGLGLGLSIVRRILTALGHLLEVESVVGRGSRFSVTVPLAEGAAPAEPPAAPPAPPPGALSGLNVLCVDNERAILDAMEGLLANWGCTVRTATSLKEIAQHGMIEGWVPDLVLMDYHLDQTSGLDAIEWLRQNVGGHLPAALVTADRTQPVRALAESRDIAVLNKPVKPAALRALLARLGRREP